MKLKTIFIRSVGMFFCLACMTPIQRRFVHLASTSREQPTISKSAPAAVDDTLRFYALDNKHSIRFAIFKKVDAQWQGETFLANPGDRIGRADNSPPPTDFDTGWTLLDVREDPAGNIENKIIVLGDDAGRILIHEISVDRQDPTLPLLINAVINPPPLARKSKLLVSFAQSRSPVGTSGAPLGFD